MVLIVDAVEFCLEVLRNIHLHDVDIRHGGFLCAARSTTRRLGESKYDTIEFRGRPPEGMREIS